MRSDKHAATSGPGFRTIVGAYGWRPLVVLSALNLTDELDRAVVVLFAPNIRRYFDISNATLGGIVGLQVALVILASVPVGWLGTRCNRVRLVQLSGVVWATFCAATALAGRLPTFILIRIGTGIGKAAVEPVGRSLLSDSYPPTVWNRVFATHSAANPLGQLLGPLAAAVVGLFVAGDGAWRVAFPAMAIPAVVVLFLSRSMREPAVGEATTSEGAVVEVALSRGDLGLRGAVASVFAIPTFRRQTLAIGVLGFALVGIGTFLSIFYEEIFDVGESGRGIILAILATGSLLGALIGGPVGERVFQRDPRAAITLVAVGIVGFCVLIGVSAFLPSIGSVVGVQWLAAVGVTIAVSPMMTVLTAVCRPDLRPLIYALLGVCVALLGGVFGGVLVGAVADAFGIRAGIASVAPFGVAGGLLMLRSRVSVLADIDHAAQTPNDEAPPPASTPVIRARTRPLVAERHR